MGQVLQFRRKNAFLPEATIAMGEAYDAALSSLNQDAKSELFVRELVAKRIVQAASSEKKTESTFAKRDYRDSPGLVVGLDRSGNGGSSGAALLMTGSTLSGTIIASCVRRRESA